MAAIIKPSEGERFSLKVFSISEDEVKVAALRDMANRRRENMGLRAGSYVKLVDKKYHEIVMSDTAMERQTNSEFLRKANGHVLIGGLGIGMILLAAQEKPEVQTITVIEKYQEVIDLLMPTLPINNKVKIINDDIFTWKPTQKYDTIYMDIWNNITSDCWPEHTKLARKYGHYLNRDNPKYWYGSWRKKDFKPKEKNGYYW